ncbi:MAG: adenylate/guanylate cyclase domain-containing response regulator [Gammaproteobacteria bacterium]|nr:adenylate/guanylate cyclase domain-containing response regulator [Gammaproteobacteria bacterium]
MKAQQIETKLLIVDDSNTVRLMLREFLTSDKEHRFLLHFAEDGEQALRYLCGCEHNELPDVILLDRNMPNMTGDECIRMLKRDEYWCLIPVLFLTAQGDKSEVVKGLSHLGADDYLAKPFDAGEMLARVNVLARIKRAEDRNRALNKSLEKANRFIRDTFGRYLSDDIVNTILESPDGLALGGEKRTLTIMMTDLRGFTAISERLPAESVVGIINIYLEAMTEVIFKYQGTIDEFIGDAILAIFGAPIQRKDDAQRAVACALEMQLAMKEVNKRNREKGYPEVTMGIGINTGELVVGNIGSSKRTKYGVVGSDVNLTSRIESYTAGEQIFISESTLEACGPVLRIDDQIKVQPKGVKKPITISEVSGISNGFNIFLPEKEIVEPLELAVPIPIEFTLLVGKDVGEQLYEGKIVKLLAKTAEIQADIVPEKFMNLKIILYGAEREPVTAELYAKVREMVSESPPAFRVVFTSIPPQAQDFLECQNFTDNTHERSAE